MLSGSAAHMPSGRLNPTAPVTAVWAGLELAESVRAAPTCRFRENGNKLPPISRNAAFPPMEVKLSVARAGFQLATPAVRVIVPMPSDARPPHVFPFP